MKGEAGPVCGEHALPLEGADGAGQGAAVHAQVVGQGLPFLRRLLCPVFRHFSAGVPLSCPRLAGSLLLLRLVWPVLPGPACWKCARVLPCAAFFVYLLPFPA